MTQLKNKKKCKELFSEIKKEEEERGEGKNKKSKQKNH